MGRNLVIKPGGKFSCSVSFNADKQQVVVIKDRATGQELYNSGISNPRQQWSFDNATGTTAKILILGVFFKNAPSGHELWRPSAERILFNNYEPLRRFRNIVLGTEDSGDQDFNDTTVIATWENHVVPLGLVAPDWDTDSIFQFEQLNPF